MQRNFWATLAWLGVMVVVCALPTQAETAWDQCLGSYALVSDKGAKGLLMLKPLDEGCVLFDLTASGPQLRQDGADEEAASRQEARESNTVTDAPSEGKETAPVSYRLTGIFFLDEEGRGHWENDKGQGLSFSLFHHRVKVQGAGNLPAELNGNFKQCSRTINGTAAMIEKFIYYLPQFKTELSHSENYQVSDVSVLTSDYRQLHFAGDQGTQKDFWVMPDLSQVLRVEGLNGVVLYQQQ